MVVVFRNSNIYYHFRRKIIMEKVELMKLNQMIKAYEKKLKELVNEKSKLEWRIENATN